MLYGDVIRLKRMELGLSRCKLGKLVGYEHSGSGTLAVNRWEAMTAYVPTQYLRKLSEILQVPVEMLIP